MKLFLSDTTAIEKGGQPTWKENLKVLEEAQMGLLANVMH